MTLTKTKVKKHLDDAKITLKNLEKKKEDRISISKKSLINYCNDTIIFCEMLLVLMKEKEENIRIEHEEDCGDTRLIRLGRM